MRFEDERYVRLYTRETVTTRKVGWEGRTILRELLTRVDRAGIFALSGEHPVTAVSLIGGFPEDITQVGLTALLESETVLWLPQHDCLYLPRFLEAQEAASSNALRQKVKRERAKAKEVLDVIEADENLTKETSLFAPNQVVSSDTKRVATDTKRVATDTKRVAPAEGPESELAGGSSPRATRNVSRPTRNVSPPTQNVSRPTQSDLLKPSLPKAKPLASYDGGSSSERRQGSSTPVSKAEWQPSGWLVTSATEMGLSRASLGSVIAEYRRNGQNDYLLPSQHDKCFAGFLRAAKQRNGGHHEGNSASGRKDSLSPESSGGSLGRYGGNREQAAADRAQAKLAEARSAGKL